MLLVEISPHRYCVLSPQAPLLSSLRAHGAPHLCSVPSPRPLNSPTHPRARPSPRGVPENTPIVVRAPSEGSEYLRGGLLPPASSDVHPRLSSGALRVENNTHDAATRHKCFPTWSYMMERMGMRKVLSVCPQKTAGLDSRCSRALGNSKNVIKK